ncbi:GAF domain-containing protein [Oceanicola sp. 502str15]|uniref:helix-turn-helix domain-containing protein n=1 Tax=Oceanicola sp. 502str15 TaxID=2696061 RepID=UPI0020951AE7|nr:GAF domain-containing protein [Oceanicola sp. 502str15]MCO6384873.1 GAF domain-containing protein [Oceanicola sp. 502str15]
MERDSLPLVSRIVAEMVEGQQASAVQPLLDQLGTDHADLAEDLGRLARAPEETALAERGLTLLIETAHDLSSTLSLKELLGKIVSRARNLAGAHVAWLTMLDEDEGLFRNYATEGNLSPGTAEMKADILHGVVGHIMQTKSFFTTADYLNDTGFRHSEALDEQFRRENISSLAGFPILSEGRVMGLLFVADRYSRKYSGREISVIGSFAQHAGVAMNNARSFARLSEALDTAEQARGSLQRHIAEVEDSAHSHDEMMSLLARGADLQSFMQRMASLVSGAIFYLDPGFQIRDEVADSRYSGTLGEALRDGKMDHAALLSAIARSRRSGRSELMAERDGDRALVLSLHGGLPRGDSLVICHQGDIGRIPLRNLERSAVALSIAKLWAEKRQADQLIAASTLLRHLVLVSPPDASTLEAVRDRLDMGAQEPVQMLLVTFSGPDREAQTDHVRTAAGRLSLLVDLVDDAYLAVGPLPEIAQLAERLQRQDRGVTAGGLLSPPVTALEDCAATWREMSGALRVMQRIAPLTRVIDHAEIGLFGRLFEQADPERIRDLVARRLAPIRARDPKGRAQLARTLLCYFDCQHNMARTADSLSVHVNTVRQRLDTLRHVTGGWDDPTTFLELHVALRLDHLSAAPGTDRGRRGSG